MAKHRENYEEYLGRKLKSSEILHHINLDRKNNDINNLFLCDKEDHGKIHKKLNNVLKRLLKRAIKNGIVKFNKFHGVYSINEKFDIVYKDSI